MATCRKLLGYGSRGLKKMPRSRIEEEIPELKSCNYRARITSPKTENYNCVAWAAN